MATDEPKIRAESYASLPKMMQKSPYYPFPVQTDVMKNITAKNMKEEIELALFDHFALPLIVQTPPLYKALWCHIDVEEDGKNLTKEVLESLSSGARVQASLIKIQLDSLKFKKSRASDVVQVPDYIWAHDLLNYYYIVASALDVHTSGAFQSKIEHFTMYTRPEQCAKLILDVIGKDNLEEILNLPRVDLFTKETLKECRKVKLDRSIARKIYDLSMQLTNEIIVNLSKRIVTASLGADLQTGTTNSDVESLDIIEKYTACPTFIQMRPLDFNDSTIQDYHRFLRLYIVIKTMNLREREVKKEELDVEERAVEAYLAGLKDCNDYPDDILLVFLLRQLIGKPVRKAIIYRTEHDNDNSSISELKKKMKNALISKKHK